MVDRIKNVGVDEAREQPRTEPLTSTLILSCLNITLSFFPTLQPPRTKVSNGGPSLFKVLFRNVLYLWESDRKKRINKFEKEEKLKNIQLKGTL